MSGSLSHFFPVWFYLHRYLLARQKIKSGEIHLQTEDPSINPVLLQWPAQLQKCSRTFESVIVESVIQGQFSELVTHCRSLVKRKLPAGYQQLAIEQTNISSIPESASVQASTRQIRQGVTRGASSLPDPEHETDEGTGIP